LLVLVLKTTSCAALPMVRAPLLAKFAPKVKVKVPDDGPFIVVVPKVVLTTVDV